MKNIYIPLILALLGFQANAQSKLKVVASASIFQDMAAHIGGDKIEAYSIVPIGGDPHLYEPKPSDATLVKSADLILVNGLTFEGWIAKLIANSGANTKPDTITAGVEALKSEKYKNASDPHAWMSAKNGLIYIENIKNALVRTDPSNADYYISNYEQYKKEIDDLDNYIVQEIKKIPQGQRMIVTSHDAFAYFGLRYGLELNALKGISTEAETQTADMIRVSKAIKHSGVPAIFIESTINPAVIQQIAKDNNVKIGGELFADSVGDKDSEGPTYTTMLKHNTDVIVKALSQNKMTATKIDTDKNEGGWMIYLAVGLMMLAALGILIAKFNK